ncbi:TPA: DDE-type integrase/transposase/recombinase [Bacillus cereus]|nr:DDE-type integrase/transposase/recombinase [Bacillus cereus]HDR8116673.1 DDE-type integrase/transposase/recombinase [Bacillus cereus]
MRWLHEYGNVIYQMWKKKNKSAHLVWHLDEIYIKVKGEWRYLYRAIETKRFMRYTNKREVRFQTSLLRRTKNYSNYSKFHNL